MSPCILPGVSVPVFNPQSFADRKVIRYPSVSLVRLSVHHVEMLNAEFKWKISDISVGICWNYFDSVLVLSIIFIYAESWKSAKPNMQSVRLTIPSFSRSQITGWTLLGLPLDVLSWTSSPSAIQSYLRLLNISQILCDFCRHRTDKNSLTDLMRTFHLM